MYRTRFYKSLDLAVSHFLIKLYKSVNLDLINECDVGSASTFRSLASELLEKRIAKFQKKDTKALAT